ncbi:GNAT family N-acetyltransferase [Alteribacter populi]|uniref:GNAT family N-acetyltransferase n=1 Tax=Alteribacter populi TaxID=2011011 RepID=UPI000BBACB7C|nr:GNAT family protein [Alteribacter populi]
MYQKDNVMIRQIEEADLKRLWELTRKEENPEWKKWDAPYFKHQSMTYENYFEQKDHIVAKDDVWAIVVDGSLVGTVSYYWEHQPSRWLELGIGIYDPKYWSGGYGTKAFAMWVYHVFEAVPHIQRVGYTTWSGNERMMKVGEKLGFTLEGRMRKVRYFDGEYYDSIRMGMLRVEWRQVSSHSDTGGDCLI